MKQVRYSRIFQRKSCSALPRLFIRDFPLNAFLGFLSISVFSFSNPVHAAVTPLKDSVTTPIELEEGFIYKDHTLQTCCSYQSQFNENEARCRDEPEQHDNLVQRTPFPETLTMPDHLISRVYRNITPERTFRQVLKFYMIKLDFILKFSSWLR